MEYAYKVVDFIHAAGWALVPVALAGALHSVSQYFTARADEVDLNTEVLQSKAGNK